MTQCDYCNRGTVVWHAGPHDMTLCSRERCKEIWCDWLSAKVDTRECFDWLLEGKEWSR